MKIRKIELCKDTSIWDLRVYVKLDLSKPFAD